MKLLLTILTTKEKLDLYTCKNIKELNMTRDRIIISRENPDDIQAELQSTIYNLTNKPKILPKYK